MSLNPAQRAAVETLAGPLLVLAGAGTGKTRVVTHRIAHLIGRGTPPARILAVTFTNKAANEMQQRAAELLGKRRPERPEISTFHSLCVRILRRHAARLGYPRAFAIYDRSDQEGVARAALREIKVDEALLKPGDLLGQIGRWKSRSLGPAEAIAAAETDKEHLAASAYRRYEIALRAAGAMDFDDLLLRTEELFARFADARRQEADRFAHVMIDEYQDTNASQYRIVRHLALGHRNLCVVGDDDQSIYGWRGAEVAHILRFSQDWPDAKVVRLEDNYRSTAAILDWANRLIRFNRQRHDKVLRAARPGGERPRIVQCRDESEEAERVVADIQGRLSLPGVELRDFAILFRTNEQPRAFELELRKRRVPYVLIGGQSFYDRKEIRDVLAYLKLLARPDDEPALRRVINAPPRGLGAGSVARLSQHALAHRRSLWSVLSQPGEVVGLSPAAGEAAKAFAQVVEQFRARLDRDPLVETVSQFIAAVKYRDEIERAYKEPADQQARWNSVEEVVNALGAYAKRERSGSLAGFLDEILLSERDFDKDKESQLARNAVALMTLHSAKGLEFPQVYLVGMEEGLLPHRKSVDVAGDAIDEERRLCYVGITRAQDRLTLTLALSRMKWGKPRDSVPSRFLFEIVGEADNPRAGAPTKQAPAAATPWPPSAPKAPARPRPRNAPRRKPV